jgi:hypothetical protein
MLNFRNMVFGSLKFEAFEGSLKNTVKKGRDLLGSAHLARLVRLAIEHAGHQPLASIA